MATYNNTVSNPVDSFTNRTSSTVSSPNSEINQSEQIQIQKTIYGLRSFNNVINTNFSQLVQPLVANVDERIFSVNDFFNEYNNLFLDIPPSGSENSHLGLATRSLESLGLSLDDLTNEVNNLRQENIELKNQIIQLTNITPGELEDII